MKKYGKRRKSILPAMIMAFVFLTGCGGFEQQETESGQAKAGESSIEVIDFNDDMPTQEQETKTQEAREPETTVQNTEVAEESMVKRQPPEEFELKFASDDWGLSFGEPGTQSVGNASAQDLAWYGAYYVGDNSEKVIYLTFDCGYENGNTEPILGN